MIKQEIVHTPNIKNTRNVLNSPRKHGSIIRCIDSFLNQLDEFKRKNSTHCQLERS